MDPREKQRLVLLAATLAYELRRRGGGESRSDPGRFWNRTAHPHRRRVMWNPGRLQSSWRLDGRLKQHGAVPSEI